MYLINVTFLHVLLQNVGPRKTRESFIIYRIRKSHSDDQMIRWSDDLIVIRNEESNDKWFRNHSMIYF